MQLFLTLFKLYYALTIGYVPLDTLQVYEQPEEARLLFVTFEEKLSIKDVLFVGGEIQTDMTQDGLFDFCYPFQLKFTIFTYLRWNGFEVGWLHYCIHPMITFAEYREAPDIQYEGGRSEIYIKFSNTKE